jgi:hypothetical protein
MSPVAADRASAASAPADADDVPEPLKELVEDPQPDSSAATAAATTALRFWIETMPAGCRIDLTIS